MYYTEVRDRKIIILVGRGKSVLTRFFVDESILENETVQLDYLDGSESFLEQLLSAKFVCGYDVTKKFDWSLTKKIISGEEIAVCRQYRKTVLKKLDNLKFIIHLSSEEALKNIPKSIKKRALIYKLDF